MPPPAPPSGPRSTIQSAVLITSRLCSITTTVLPWSRSRCSTVSSSLDVVEVQSRGRLVEDVERASGVALGQFQRQLHPLRLAARERRRRLAQRDVAEAHVEQRGQLARDRRHRLEERVRLLDGHRQHFVDVPALVADLQRLAVVALAVADVAGDVDVGQKMHLDLDQAVALAGFAAPALDVEGSPSRASDRDDQFARGRGLHSDRARTARSWCRAPGSGPDPRSAHPRQGGRARRPWRRAACRPR